MDEAYFVFMPLITLYGRKGLNIHLNPMPSYRDGFPGFALFTIFDNEPIFLKYGINSAFFRLGETMAQFPGDSDGSMIRMFLAVSHYRLAIFIRDDGSFFQGSRRFVQRALPMNPATYGRMRNLEPAR